MQLTRRRFLQASGVGVTALVAPPWLQNASAAPAADSVLVVIFLRGGTDGLSVAIPSGDEANLAVIRPNIRFAGQRIPITSSFRNAANQGGGMESHFELQQNLTGLKSIFDAGELAIVHATGRTGSYSHFTAMDGMEQADPVAPNRPDGWLFRAAWQLSTLASEPSLTAVGLNPQPIDSLLGTTPAGGGAARTTTMQTLASFDLAENPDASHLGVLQWSYDAANMPGWEAGSKHAIGLQRDAGERLFDALSVIDPLPKPTSLVGTPYEGVSFGIGMALRDAAELIDSGVGVRVIAIDLGADWDQHTNLVSRFDNSSQTLDGAFSAFHGDLTARGLLGKTLTLAMTEFGRTAFENGTAGTDHGFGTVMLAMGGGVIGQRVLCRAQDDASNLVGWPGLGPGELHQGQRPKYSSDIAPADIAAYEAFSQQIGNQTVYDRDLEVTIDFRDVFAEVLGPKFLGLAPGDVSGDDTKPLLGYTPVALPDDGLLPDP